MPFQFSGFLGLLILGAFLCLAVILGKGFYWTLQGRRLLARSGQHNSEEALQTCYDGFALFLLGLFIVAIILSLHATSELLAVTLLIAAILLFLASIATCMYRDLRLRHTL